MLRSSLAMLFLAGHLAVAVVLLLLAGGATAAPFTVCGRRFTNDLMPMDRLPGNVAVASTGVSGGQGGSADDVEAIRDVISRYPPAVDSKNFDGLDSVFVADATGNYQAPLNIVEGRDAIKKGIALGISQVDTQHSYGTQTIRVLDARCGLAVSQTYFTATHFGRGPLTGQVGTVYGAYQDVLVRDQASAGAWRIRQRAQRILGPGIIGNPLVFL